MSENEYKEIVLRDFDRKKAASLLTSELMAPTPGNLKSESVRICEIRYHSKDEVLLSSFFNQKENGAAYRLAIQNANADLFRPLASFLKDRTINTTLRNINLLAWLIDFQPRPYHPDLIYKAEDDRPAPEPIPPIEPRTAGHRTIQPLLTLHSSARISKKARFLFVLFFGVVLTGYFANYYLLRRTTGREGCMVWDEDHYQPVECRKNKNSNIIPIDRQRVNIFKKITRPDTLSFHSVGKIWYAKFKGRVEFYTAAGVHPLDTNRRLLPMSDHILKKYVYHLEN